MILGNPLNPLAGLLHSTSGDGHLRLFSYRGFRDACEYHGFRILNYQSVGYYPLPPRFSQVATRLDRWHGAFLVATQVKP